MTKVGEFFPEFAAKKLSAVDIDAARSQQSEIGGTDGLRAIFGAPADKIYLDARYVYLEDDADTAPEILHAPATWYDPRRNNPNRKPEYRLLYRAKAAPVISRVMPGDTLFIARRPDRTVYLIFAKEGSTILRQLQWLFGVEARETLLVGPDTAEQPELEPLPIDLLARLGIEVDFSDEALLSKIPKRYLDAADWPTGVEMAELAQSLVTDAHPVEDPDLALVSWVRMETRLFQTVEKHRIAGLVAAGFLNADGEVDVDAFLRLSLSVNNRRKSRAGSSLELHMTAILKRNGIYFDRQATTEGKKKPDFLFPSKSAYQCDDFPETHLTMLGSKTTLKDRWRQVLNEANRIENKHLLTLQPGISEDQTDEMKAHNLRLVIPRHLHGEGFSRNQLAWLLSVETFIDLLRSRQAETMGLWGSTSTEPLPR